MRRSMSVQEPLFAEERKGEIVRLAAEQAKLLVLDLAERFNVSPVTIRSDLRELEQLGLLRRTHGGAMAIGEERAGFEPDNKCKTAHQMEQKRMIARKALEFIQDGDIIILDTGTTTLELAKLLSERNHLTVVVNDLEIAGCLEQYEHINVVMIGGTVRKQFQCTVGLFAIKLLKELNVDKAFMATNSVSLARGCTTPDIAQAEVKKAMLEVSTQSFLLCDSSKFEHNAFVQFAPLNQIDIIITDIGLNPDIYDQYWGAGCELAIAGHS